MSEKPVDLEGNLPPTGAYDTPEIEEVLTTRVSCDGGMTHPRIWMQIPLERGWVECGYCDKRFVLKDGADAH